MEESSNTPSGFMKRLIKKIHENNNNKEEENKGLKKTIIKYATGIVVAGTLITAFPINLFGGVLNRSNDYRELANNISQYGLGQIAPIVTTVGEELLEISDNGEYILKEAPNVGKITQDIMKMKFGDNITLEQIKSILTLKGMDLSNFSETSFNLEEEFEKLQSKLMNFSDEYTSSETLEAKSSAADSFRSISEKMLNFTASCGDVISEYYEDFLSEPSNENLDEVQSLVDSYNVAYKIIKDNNNLGKQMELACVTEHADVTAEQIKNMIESRGRRALFSKKSNAYTLGQKLGEFAMSVNNTEWGQNIEETVYDLVDGIISAGANEKEDKRNNNPDVAKYVEWFVDFYNDYKDNSIEK